MDIFEFITKNNIKKVDLIKINIEGGEYALIKRLIDKGLINRFSNIQVQFHDFIPNAKELRNKLRTQLEKTHKLTYDFPFVWENWQRLK